MTNQYQYTALTWYSNYIGNRKERAAPQTHQDAHPTNQPQPDPNRKHRLALASSAMAETRQNKTAP